MPQSKPRSPRDRYPEAHAFLAAAGVHPEFAERAHARIQAQTDELDHSYLWCSLPALVTKCQQQGEDVGALAALIADRLQQDAGRQFTTTRAVALLTCATQRAGEADALIGALRRLLDADRQRAA